MNCGCISNESNFLLFSIVNTYVDVEVYIKIYMSCLQIKLLRIDEWFNEDGGKLECMYVRSLRLSYVSSGRWQRLISGAIFLKGKRL